MFIFLVQLTTSRIGNLTLSILTLFATCDDHTYIHTYIHQCEWHIMTRMTAGLRGYVQFNKYTYIHNLGSNKEAGGAQGAQGSSEICTSRESVSPLSPLIRGFRNKYH